MAALNMALQMVCLSDLGLVYENNEDNVAIDPVHGLAVLADGVGGQNAGEVASEMTTVLVLGGMQQELQTGLMADPGQTLVRHVEAANRAVYQRAQCEEDCAGMASTVVATMFYDNKLYVAHLGDSRLYRLRADSLECLTRDHSVLQQQIDAGYLTKAEARHSTQKNLVTRALGVDEHESPELQEYAVQSGDLYLLCSDGLNDMVEDDDIELNLSMLGVNLELCAQHLIQAALDNGGRDNVSVILIRVDQDFGMKQH